MRRKRGLCLLLAASMALGSSFTVLAADKKIDTVKLSFSYSKAPARVTAQKVTVA